MSAVCENYAQVLEETIEPGGKTFFSEIVASISDIKVRQHLIPLSSNAVQAVYYAVYIRNAMSEYTRLNSSIAAVYLTCSDCARLLDAYLHMLLLQTTQCGRYIVSRDYMTLKLWDLNMGGKPVVTIPVHDHLRPQVCYCYYCYY
jgi:hypothetical protein